MSIKLISYMIVTSLLLNQSVVYAGIGADFNANTVVTPSGFSQGQKRGYVSGGAVSMRWPTSNDKLFTATPPKFSGGCGGIDLFMGGFSFLNFDYLVKKFQSMLQAAPALAFDLALNVLCTPCANAIKTLTAVSDFLNGLNIDDCKVAKTAVVASATSLGFLSEANTAQKSEVEARYGVKVGTVKSYYEKIEGEIATGIQGITGSPTQTTKSTAGCSMQFKDVFNKPGSLLANMATSGLNSISADELKLIRGMIGDISIDAKAEGKPVKACYENISELNIDYAAKGLVKGRAINGNCEDATVFDPETNFVDRLEQAVYIGADSIYYKKAAGKNGTALTAEQTLLIEQSPVPLEEATRYAVQTGDMSIMYVFAGIAAKSYAHTFYSNLYRKALYLVASLEGLLLNEKAATTECEKKEAQLSVVTLKTAIENPDQKVFLNQLLEGYRKSLNDNQSYFIALTSFFTFKEYATKNLSKSLMSAGLTAKIN